MSAIAKRLLVPVVILICLLSLCSCYSKDYFVRSLDSQFGAGSYTLQETPDENEYLITLNDYPDLPFCVGSRVSGLPYEYSKFSSVFGQAILDDYKKVASLDSTMYTLGQSGENFLFDADPWLPAAEAEQLFNDAMKLSAIIQDKYPVYNTQDYTISNGRYILVACHNEEITQTSPEDYLEYESLWIEEKALPDKPGITIGDDLYSHIELGDCTLRKLLLTGFHINDFKGYKSMTETTVEPGGQGLSAWCNLDYVMAYEEIPLGAYNDTETLQNRNNYVYVETTNIQSVPCALKDTVVTKVIYHFNDVEATQSNVTHFLYLDGMAGDIVDTGDGFDLRSRWGLAKPSSPEEEQYGVRYKDVLVKITETLDEHNTPLEGFTDTPASVKKLDVEVTWSPVNSDV